MIFMKNRQRARFYMYANLLVGLLILLFGVLFAIFQIDIVENKKAIIGLSLIPLGAAFYGWLNLFYIKKYPKEALPLVLAENDERISAMQNEADSVAFRILRQGLFLVFFGYTLMVPADVFETFTWWILFLFMALSYILQGALLAVGYKRYEATDDESGGERDA